MDSEAPDPQPQPNLTPFPPTQASPSTPSLSPSAVTPSNPSPTLGGHECPACGRRDFSDEQGRGGHLATVQDETHRAYRTTHGMASPGDLVRYLLTQPTAPLPAPPPQAAPRMALPARITPHQDEPETREEPDEGDEEPTDELTDDNNEEGSDYELPDEEVQVIDPAPAPAAQRIPRRPASPAPSAASEVAGAAALFGLLAAVVLGARWLNKRMPPPPPRPPYGVPGLPDEDHRGLRP